MDGVTWEFMQLLSSLNLFLIKLAFRTMLNTLSLCVFFFCFFFFLPQKGNDFSFCFIILNLLVFRKKLKLTQLKKPLVKRKKKRPSLFHLYVLFIQKNIKNYKKIEKNYSWEQFKPKEKYFLFSTFLFIFFIGHISS